jgi:hypothetical protein
LSSYCDKENGYRLIFVIMHCRVIGKGIESATYRVICC